MPASSSSTSSTAALISYATGETDHDADVLALAKRLAGDGVVTRLSATADVADWSVWFATEIDHADAVICVASKAYSERFAPWTTGATEAAAPAPWEVRWLLEARREASASRDLRFVDVTFDPDDKQHVPAWPDSSSDGITFVLPDAYDDLLRHLADPGQRQDATRRGFEPALATRAMRAALPDGTDDIADEVVSLTSAPDRAVIGLRRVLADRPFMSREQVVAALRDDDEWSDAFFSACFADLDIDERTALACLMLVGGVLPATVASRLLSSSRALDALVSLTNSGYIEMIGERHSFRVLWPETESLRSSWLFGSAVRPIERALVQAVIGALADEPIPARDREVWKAATSELALRSLPVDEGRRIADAIQPHMELFAVYEPTIRFREALFDAGDKSVQTGASLVRVYCLVGRLEAAQKIVAQVDDEWADGLSGPERALWEVEAGCLEADIGDPKNADGRLATVSKLTENGLLRAQAAIARAQISRRNGSLADADVLLEIALNDLSSTPGDDPAAVRMKALALHDRAVGLRFQQDHEQAKGLLERADRLSVATGNVGGVAHRQSLRAAFRSDALRMDDACGLLNSAIASYEQIGDRWGEGCARLALASALSDKGELGDARGQLEVAINLASRTRNIRVELLASGVGLTLARRRGVGERSALATAKRAERLLEDKARTFYAQRLRRGIALHEWISGAASTHQTVDAFPARRKFAGEWMDLFLFLVRPYAPPEAAPAIFPDGIELDVDRLSSVLDD